MVLVSFSAKCNFLVLQLMGTRNFVRWIFVACQQVILAILQRILTGFFLNATCTIQKGHHVAPFHVSFQEMRHEILCTCH